MVNYPSNPSFPTSYSFPSSPTYPSVVVYPTVSTFHPDTLSWRDRAIASSGIIDNIRLQKVDSLVVGVYNLGLRDSVGSDHIIIDFIPLLGNNLPAALTKLWYHSSAPTVSNFNFVENDYSPTTGLTGNRINKYINLNVVLSNLGITPSSVSVGLYNRNSISYSNSPYPVEIGTKENNCSFLIHLNIDLDSYHNGGVFDSFIDETIITTRNGKNYNSGRILNAWSIDSTKFTIISRTSLNDFRLFNRGQQVFFEDTVGANLIPNLPVTVFARNTSTGVLDFSPRTLQAIMIGKGIPANKVSALNTLVENCVAN